MENREQNEIEFDLLQMLSYLLKRVWIIILAMAVFAAAGSAINKKNEVPLYTARCRAFVFRTGSDGNYTDALGSLYLVKNCQVILQGEEVAKMVVENLDLQMHHSVITSSVVVDYEDDTHILEVSYTDTDPVRAAWILNELCSVSETYIPKLMENTTFTTMYEAEIPTVPTEGTAKNDAILGAAIGMVLSAAVLVVLFLLDDTIRSEDDVERYLGLSTLTAVTLSPDLASDAKTAEMARRKAPALRPRKK